MSRISKLDANSNSGADMKNPIDLIRAYPKLAVCLIAAVFIAVFGWLGLFASIAALVIASILAHILTKDDDDWFDPRGPRAA